MQHLSTNKLIFYNFSHYNNPELIENHYEAMEELYTTDKNRPSVIMWSVAADPLRYEGAEEYFRYLKIQLVTLYFISVL